MAEYTVDRFEGDEWAVLEDARAVAHRVPRTLVPSDAREGDIVSVLEIVDGGARVVQLRVDPAARERRLSDAKGVRDALPRGPKGDISL